MSAQCGKLCSLILTEHFGETIEKVGRDLFRGGQKPLKLIVSSTQLSLDEVRQSLCVLIKYDLVSFVPGKVAHIAEYEIHPERILLMLRYPKYLMLMKTLYGNEAETIIEEILSNGQDSASEILLQAYKKISSKNVELNQGVAFQSLRDMFEMLVNKQYIMRCPMILAKKSVPVFDKDTSSQFKPPKVDIPKLIEASTGKPVSFADGNVIWKVNFDRFHQDLRDELLIIAMARRITPDGGDVMRLVLQQMHLRSNPWASVSNPILLSELKETFRKAKVDVQLTRYLEDYMAVMAEDSSGFVTKSESTSVAYNINLKKAVEELTWCVLDNGVDAKFGANAARIFRLIRQQEFIEQEEIQKRAMLPDKEAKFLTYSLLQSGWIQQYELKKGLQKAGPTKTFFLFCIDLEQVVRMYIETCYKSLYNAITRREHEKAENKCLLEKKQRIDAIALHMRKEGATEEQVAEIEEMVTPPEHQLLEKIQLTVNKLSQAELQIDETLFILQLYLSAQIS